MDLYRRRLQVKKYAFQNDLFFGEYFHEILLHTKALSFKEFQKIVLPIPSPHLFFINKGTVAGTYDTNTDKDWYRIILKGEIFGDIAELLDIPFPKIHWFAISQVEVLAVSIEKLSAALGRNPENLKILHHHLSQMETGRMGMLNILSKLNVRQKIDFLELNFPELLIQTKYADLAKLLGVSRQILSRELNNKRQLPNDK
ncbi:Crp/Fnr family transcriptional regulator [Rhodonellum sp.]|uniref:Crp/Fnr family transcriptional regulator n=1 Tax=Rhodonellum sp. TaxID=2231180 RepID=UPI00271F0CC7|nr:hypothetical protein [Rhodonellum sp.]MDO9552235.1 hypothetical protein [Rhodonellum sp.]